MALFNAIHSVDRASLCEALAKEIAKQGRQPTLFVEINTGAEPQKAGVLPQDADAFLAACRDKYGLTISGLMCIPPLEEAPGPHFALTAKIAQPQRLEAVVDGHERGFHHRHSARRHACARRLGDFRRAAGRQQGMTDNARISSAGSNAFAAPGYLFGTAPNAFLKAQAHLLRKGDKALAIADGEGRNGVFLAEQGLDVLSVDFSPLAQEKARKLAEAARRHAAHRAGRHRRVGTGRQAAFDVVAAIFFQFVDAARARTRFSPASSDAEAGRAAAAARATA